MKLILAFFFTYLFIATTSHAAAPTRRGFLKTGAFALTAPKTLGPMAVAAPVADPVLMQILADRRSYSRTFWDLATRFAPRDSLDPDYESTGFEVPDADVDEQSVADVIRDWAVHNPDAAAPVKPLIDRYLRALGVDVTSFSDYEDNLYPEDASGNVGIQVFKKVLPRITQEPWKTLQWSKTFLPRIMQAEYELALEMGVDIKRVHATTELVLIDRGSAAYFLAGLSDWMKISGWRVDPDHFAYTPEFAQKYAAKLEKISPLYSYYLQTRQLAKAGASSPDDLTDDVANSLGLSVRESEFFGIEFNRYSYGTYKTNREIVEERLRNYKIALERLQNVRRFYAYLQGPNHDGEIDRAFNEVERRILNDVKTLPQRVTAYRHRHNRDFRDKTKKLQPTPTAESGEWLSYKLAGGARSLYKADAWLAQVREAGLPIDSFMPVTTAACEALLIENSPAVTVNLETEPVEKVPAQDKASEEKKK